MGKPGTWDVGTEIVRAWEHKYQEIVTSRIGKEVWLHVSGMSGYVPVVNRTVFNNNEVHFPRISVGFEIWTNQTKGYRYVPETNEINYNDFVGSFYLTDFPENISVVVSHSAYVNEHYRNLGIGKILNRLRCEALKNTDESIMLVAIVKDDNNRQINIMQSNGWTCIGQFMNNSSIWRLVK